DRACAVPCQATTARTALPRRGPFSDERPRVNSHERRAGKQLLIAADHGLIFVLALDSRRLSSTSNGATRSTPSRSVRWKWDCHTKRWSRACFTSMRHGDFEKHESDDQQVQRQM